MIQKKKNTSHQDIWKIPAAMFWKNLGKSTSFKHFICPRVGIGI